MNFIFRLAMDDFLLELHFLGDIDDEEFIHLYDLNRRRNLHVNLPYGQYHKFDLEQMRKDECLVEFRFAKNDIYGLVNTLQIPEAIRCYNGWKVDAVEALCICLKRRTYPCRYCDRSRDLAGPSRSCAPCLTLL